MAVGHKDLLLRYSTDNKNTWTQTWENYKYDSIIPFLQESSHNWIEILIQDEITKRFNNYIIQDITQLNEKICIMNDARDDQFKNCYFNKLIKNYEFINTVPISDYGENWYGGYYYDNEIYLIKTDANPDFIKIYLYDQENNTVSFVKTVTNDEWYNNIETFYYRREGITEKYRTLCFNEYDKGIYEYNPQDNTVIPHDSFHVALLNIYGNDLYSKIYHSNFFSQKPQYYFLNIEGNKTDNSVVDIYKIFQKDTENQLSLAIFNIVNEQNDIGVSIENISINCTGYTNIQSIKASKNFTAEFHNNYVYICPLKLNCSYGSFYVMAKLDLNTKEIVKFYDISQLNLVYPDTTGVKIRYAYLFEHKKNLYLYYWRYLQNVHTDYRLLYFNLFSEEFEEIFTHSNHEYLFTNAQPIYVENECYFLNKVNGLMKFNYEN